MSAVKTPLRIGGRQHKKAPLRAIKPGLAGFSVSGGGRAWNDQIQGLIKDYGVQMGLLPRLSGFSLRSIANWSAGEKPSGPARQRLTELNRLFKALEKIVDRKSIGGWLIQPNSAFEGSTPLQVVERGESDRLWQMIHQLGSGQPS